MAHYRCYRLLSLLLIFFISSSPFELRMAAARCVGLLLELNNIQFLDYLASTIQNSSSSYPRGRPHGSRGNRFLGLFAAIVGGIGLLF